MPLYIGGQELKECYIGGQPVQQIYIGGQEVWSAWHDIVLFHYDENNPSATFNYKVKTITTANGTKTYEPLMVASGCGSDTFFTPVIHGPSNWPSGGSSDIMCVNGGDEVYSASLAKATMIARLNNNQVNDATKGSRPMLRASNYSSGASATGTGRFYARQWINMKDLTALPKNAKYFNIKVEVTKHFSYLFFGCLDDYVFSSDNEPYKNPKLKAVQNVRETTKNDSNKFGIGTHCLSLDISAMAGNSVYFFLGLCSPYGSDDFDSENKAISKLSNYVYVEDMFVSKDLPVDYTLIATGFKQNV